MWIAWTQIVQIRIPQTRVARIHSFFVVRLNLDIEGVFVDRNIENIGAATHLTVFDVALAESGAEVYKSGAGFAAVRTSVICRGLHEVFA